MRRGGFVRSVVGALCLLLLVPAGFANGQTPPTAPDVEIVTERLLFTRGPNGPRVLHMVQLVNVGPRVAEEIPLSVPQGAVWLDVPEELNTGPNVITDPRPLAAGEARQYVFTYDLPWQRMPMVVRRPLHYPTEVMELWTESDALLLRGVNVRPIAEEEIGGINFTVAVSTDVQPHAQWQVLLETPSAPGARATPLERLGQRDDPLHIVRNYPLAGLLLFALVLLAVAAPIVQRVNARRALARTDVPSEGAAAEAGKVRRAEGEVARLKEAIVQVDVAFQNGDMDERTYNERRQALKAELLAVVRRREPGEE